MYPSLYHAPIQLPRGQSFKNRLVMAPMGTQLSFSNDAVSPADLAYYYRRSGDVAAIITGAAQVQQNGRTMPGMFGAYSDTFMPGLESLAKAISQNGTKSILQIFHAGRMTRSEDIGGLRPVGPSAVRAERPLAEVPHALTHAEVGQVIDDFRSATVRAISAGFDGVELHGANTYLIQQFYSPHSNRRVDCWGGATPVERLFFIDQLLEAVIGAAAKAGRPDFIIGYRFSPEELENPGITMADTLSLIDYVSGKGIDYLHVSLNDFARKPLQMGYQNQTVLELCYERIGGRALFMGVGGIRTPESLAQVMGSADLAAVGMAMLLDPHWARKILDGRPAMIRGIEAIPERSRPLSTDTLWEQVQKLRPDGVYSDW